MLCGGEMSNEPKSESCSNPKVIPNCIDIGEFLNLSQSQLTRLPNREDNAYPSSCRISVRLKTK